MRIAIQRIGRLLALALAAGWFCSGLADPSLLDWRYFTYEAVTPQLANPLRDAKLSVSGQWSDRGPHFVVDGKIDANGHWACEQLPAVLTIEMQKPTSLQAARIWFYYGEPRVYAFFIETSPDSATGRAWPTGRRTTNRQPGGFIVRSNSRSGASPARDYHRQQRARCRRPTSLNSSLPLLSRPASWPLPTLERITTENAQGVVESCWRATAWRNERVHGVRSLVTPTRSATAPERHRVAERARRRNPPRRPSTALRPYVLADKNRWAHPRHRRRVDLPPGGFRPVWLTVSVPARAKPGLYRGTLTVTGAGGRHLPFPLELKVLDARLPDPAEWAFYLDLWQHPWAVARYHGVEPFSPEHYRFLEPIYRELGNAGQKTLTVTITDLPWNHQNFDAYHTMIPRLKNKDGSWSFDYTLFDEYVAFGRRCGVGPHIHCYTMATWGNRVSYTDGETGDIVCPVVRPGTPEHEAYWGPFLQDFERHQNARAGRHLHRDG